MKDYTTSEIQAAMREAAKDGNRAALRDLTNLLAEAYRKEVEGSATSGMSTLERYKANLGAGMMQVARGVGQSFGAGSPAEVREMEALDKELESSVPLGGLVQGVGSALPIVAGSALPIGAAFPSLALGMNTLRGASTIGGVAGAAMPTSNENVVLGKLQNAALGAGLGYLGQRYLPSMGSALARGAGAARDFGIKQGLGTSGMRRAYADRQLLRDISDAGPPSQVTSRMRQAAMGEIPGVRPTTGQLSGSPTLLSTERALREAGGPAGMELRGRLATGNEARLDALRGVLNRDPERIAATASRFAERAKAGMELKPGGVDPRGYLRGQVTAWANKIENPQTKSLLLSLRERLLEIQRAPETQQLDLIHQFRRTALRDAQDSAFRSDRQAAKLLRRPLKSLERSLDQYLQKRLKTGDWQGFLKGYSSRMTLRDQAEAGRGVLNRIETATPMSTGEPSLQSARQLLRRELAPENAESVYGKPTFSGSARETMEDVLRSLDLEKRAYSPDIRPLGSATAENLRMMRNLGTGPSWSTPEVMSAIGAGLVNPLAAGGVVGQRMMAHRAQQDIARRLLDLYGNPGTALRALERASLPRAQKAVVARTIAELARHSSRVALPLGGTALGNSLLTSQ